MRTNVEAVLERDIKISKMDDRADALHQGIIVKCVEKFKFIVLRISTKNYFRIGQMKFQ